MPNGDRVPEVPTFNQLMVSRNELSIRRSSMKTMTPVANSTLLEAHDLRSGDL